MGNLAVTTVMLEYTCSLLSMTVGLSIQRITDRRATVISPASIVPILPIRKTPSDTPRPANVQSLQLEAESQCWSP